MSTSFDRHIYRVLLSLAGFMLVLGTVVYHAVEKFSWVDAYYFSVVTLATVGFGDFAPKTTFGKIFTTFYILVGVGIITTFISYAMRRRAARYEDRRK